MSVGIAIRPARRMTVQNGKFFQICDRHADPNEVHREVSQSGAVTWKTSKIRLLSRPYSPLSSQWIEMNAGNAGTAHGSTKIISRALFHQPRRMKKPDSSSARNSFKL